MKRFTVSTSRQVELVDITARLREEIQRAGVESGFCVVHCPHTTAGLTINEHTDPSVADDLVTALDRLVPEEGPWTHREGNAPAHVKASLMGASVRILIDRGEPALGTWQGVFLCEFDGPRSREVWLRFVA